MDGNFGLINYLLMYSYNILPDDNSYLSNHCEEFVDETFGICNKTVSWGHITEPKYRLYDHLIWQHDLRHINLQYNIMECDDARIKSTGVWKYFVR